MGGRRTWWGMGALLALALVAAGASGSPAATKMHSTKLDRHLCKTVHGGRFVAIPGFPGEKIDRRLLPDIRWMKHRFHIFVTDGYSNDPVHAGNGEHPIGLAADIVPNRAAGGTWNEIGELAHLAEPTQDHPIAPWRWVGWNGDPGHGRGNHLHLSWSHSPSKPRHPARVVYTRKCPAPAGGSESRHHHRRTRGGNTGGTSPSGGGTPPNGGIPARAKLAPAVPDN
ncbi:MAG: hypothetical protein ACRDK1_09715 [Solirubrobacterales bacterium]